MPVGYSGTPLAMKLGIKTDLQGELDALADGAFPNRSIWNAWPKKTSGVQTDLTVDRHLGQYC